MELESDIGFAGCSQLGIGQCNRILRHFLRSAYAPRRLHDRAAKGLYSGEKLLEQLGVPLWAECQLVNLILVRHGIDSPSFLPIDGG